MYDVKSLQMRVRKLEQEKKVGFEPGKPVIITQFFNGWEPHQGRPLQCYHQAGRVYLHGSIKLSMDAKKMPYSGKKEAFKLPHGFHPRKMFPSDYIVVYVGRTADCEVLVSEI